MNELDCTIAHINCGNYIVNNANWVNVKHKYINTHFGKPNWVIELTFTNRDGSVSVETIKSYRKCINYLKKVGGLTYKSIPDRKVA